jgi:hypothetical protein
MAHQGRSQARASDRRCSRRTAGNRASERRAGVLGVYGGAQRSQVHSGLNGARFSLRDGMRTPCVAPRLYTRWCVRYRTFRADLRVRADLHRSDKYRLRAASYEARRSRAAAPAKATDKSEATTDLEAQIMSSLADRSADATLHPSPSRRTGIRRLRDRSRSRLGRRAPNGNRQQSTETGARVSASGGIRDHA